METPDYPHLDTHETKSFDGSDQWVGVMIGSRVIYRASPRHKPKPAICLEVDPKNGICSMSVLLGRLVYADIGIYFTEYEYEVGIARRYDVPYRPPLNLDEGPSWCFVDQAHESWTDPIPRTSQVAPADPTP